MRFGGAFIVINAEECSSISGVVAGLSLECEESVNVSEFLFMAQQLRLLNLYQL